MIPQIEYGHLLSSMLNFVPEVVVCVGIVGLLLMRMLKLFDRLHLGGMAMLIALIALLYSVCQWLGYGGIEAPSPYALMFGDTSAGMLVYDRATVFLRIFLYAFAVLVIWLTILTGIPDREDSGDFYVLLLGATLGMALMGSAVHLLMVFIAIEMASLPSYAMAGFLKGKRRSSEAALKYVVYGGGAAGVMLYGISLIAGKFGTGYLPDVAAGLVFAIRQASEGGGIDPVLALGTLFILVGIAFKLAAVPFHFWCPDVFEGAAAEVAGFLSVASKAAALVLLARFTLILGGMDPVVGSVLDAPWMSVIAYLIPVLAFMAALTATFGNLAAYAQTNLKRLLAYSTIAHAGYMMMALCTLRRSGVEAMFFYATAYLLMNLGAFAVVAFLRNQTGSEDLKDFRGLIRRSPIMVVTLCVFLLSLLGIPPLLGFAAKFQVFASLFTEGQWYYRQDQPGLGATLIGLLVVGGINTVISAVYYLKVMKVMILDRRTEDLEGTEPPPLREPWFATTYVGLLAAATLVLGVLWGPLDAASRQTAERFRNEPGKDVLAARPAGGLGGMGAGGPPGVPMPPPPPPPPKKGNNKK